MLKVENNYVKYNPQFKSKQVLLKETLPKIAVVTAPVVTADLVLAQRMDNFKQKEPANIAFTEKISVLKKYLKDYFDENEIKTLIDNSKIITPETVDIQTDILRALKDTGRVFRKKDILKTIQPFDYTSKRKYPRDLQLSRKMIDLLGDADLRIHSWTDESDYLDSSDFRFIMEVMYPREYDYLKSLKEKLNDIPFSLIYKIFYENHDRGDVDEFITKYVETDCRVERIREKQQKTKTEKIIQKINDMDLDIGAKSYIPTELNPLNIDDKSLVLVHLTEYEPHNGKILSAREALNGASRNTVHFSLNHAVGEHGFGNWTKCHYAILMPFKSTIESNADGKFVEGMPNDLYSDGSVNIPEGSVIIKYNDSLADEEIKIHNSADIKGVKIIESSSFPQGLVPAIIKKMGFTHIGSSNSLGTFDFGENSGESANDRKANFKAWQEFCRKHNIVPVVHGNSLCRAIENIIEGIDMLATCDKWVTRDGNFKNDLLENIKHIKKYAQKGYYINVDIEKLEEIIKESNTPMMALGRLYKETGLKPTINRKKWQTEEYFSLNHRSRLELTTSYPQIIDKWYDTLEDGNLDRIIKS